MKYYLAVDPMLTLGNPQRKRAQQVLEMYGFEEPVESNVCDSQVQFLFRQYPSEMMDIIFKVPHHNL